ncbi:hypothetical protein BA895_01020 [Humibacillus sp. DSM 29435]|uniref:hypothetical protein n=1 Tax=Humibacillus sp. DSM 29435 TaxID=1869167 RepID=UPI000872B81D|nr:hypothetical protein [Humibacillus sp. DSM 29435]OFE18797.1 hypothetical protein BA895_01020 [Humibacillus sp. DSM 29435]
MEVSTDGATWKPAASGTIDATNCRRYNAVPASGDTQGTRYVRFTILGNQVPDLATRCPAGSFDGCSYTDMTEPEVFGAAG